MRGRNGKDSESAVCIQSIESNEGRAGLVGGDPLWKWGQHRESSWSCGHDGWSYRAQQKRNVTSFTMEPTCKGKRTRLIYHCGFSFMTRKAKKEKKEKAKKPISNWLFVEFSREWLNCRSSCLWGLQKKPLPSLGFCIQESSPLDWRGWGGRKRGRRRGRLLWQIVSQHAGGACFLQLFYNLLYNYITFLLQLRDFIF